MFQCNTKKKKKLTEHSNFQSIMTALLNQGDRGARRGREVPGSSEKIICQPRRPHQQSLHDLFCNVNKIQALKASTTNEIDVEKSTT